MPTPLPNPRYERKFVTAGFSLHDLEAIIRRHPAGFREAYRPRIINNVYLDSPGLRNFHDHVNGAANRSKTRIRWYGPPAREVQKPLLERKLKSGQVSGKIVEPLPGFTMNGV